MSNELVAQIFKKIDFLRDQHGLTDYQVANGIGFTASGYSRIKQGRRGLKVEFMELIAKFFKVPLPYLFFTGGELGNFYIRSILQDYCDNSEQTVEVVASQIGLNVLRLVEILEGGTINPGELNLINQFFKQTTEHLKTWDELLYLMLLEIGIDELKIALIIEYLKERGLS